MVGLSLNLVLIDVVRLTGQQALGILLLVPPQDWGYRHVAFYVGVWGSEFRPSLSSEPAPPSLRLPLGGEPLWNILAR